MNMKKKFYLVLALSIVGIVGIVTVQPYSQAEVSNSKYKPVTINKMITEETTFNSATSEVGISFTADFSKDQPLLMKDIDKVLRDRLISDAKVKFDENKIVMNAGDIVSKELKFHYTSNKLKECFFNNNGLPKNNDFGKNKEFISVTVKIDKPSTEGHKTQYHFITYIPERALSQ